MIGRGYRTLSLLLLAIFVSVIGGKATATAQEYPNRPVRIVVPVAPGGGIDYVGRTLAQHLSEGLGQPVVIDNRPGASSMTGLDAVARSAPDGYTLLLIDRALLVNPLLRPGSIAYDVFDRLEPVSIVSSSPLVLVVSPALPVKNFAEFLAYGKTKPNNLHFASPGIGTTTHLAAEIFKLRSGLAATHVAYRGVGSSFTDLINDEIQFIFSSIPGASPLVHSNRIRALATTGRSRSPQFPDLPTVDEAGIPDFEVEFWLGLFAPKPLPPEVRTRLHAEVKKALAKSELAAGWAKVGIRPVATTPEESMAFLRAEHELWKKVVAESDLKTAVER